MIPKRLTLHNFLSYRDATLDFQGFHVACICGSNGAGKSSLLEAMVWALWGQSRVAVDDDVIHAGTEEAKVDFVFKQGYQTYRILRGRRRKQSSFLEFQIEAEEGFRSLTQRGIRATQEQIDRHLNINYETFVHSAYLRQGQVDEFMLKRPSERKQLLADLLKLDHYDQLTEQAKGKSRDYRVQSQLLEAALTSSAKQLQQQHEIRASYLQLQQLVTHEQVQQLNLAERLEGSQYQQHQRHDWSQEQSMLQQHLVQLEKNGTQISQELQQGWQQLHLFQATLDEADVIEQGYQKLLSLRTTEEALTVKFQAYRQLQEQKISLQQQKTEILGQLKGAQNQQQIALETLRTQCVDLQHILNKRAGVEKTLKQLHDAQTRLKHLNQIQLQVAPLQQRHQELYVAIQREEARVAARLGEIINTQHQLEVETTQRPQLMQSVMDVGHRLAYLEQRQAYQEQVRQKGQERRHFMERLQAEQRHCEIQLAQLDQKVQLMSAPDASCPVCEQPLQEHSRDVLERYRQEQQSVQDRIWVIREQLSVSEREIQVLRQEYREIEDELMQYADILHQRGRLHAQLSSSARVVSQLAQLESERASLENCLQDSQFATNLHEEFQNLSQALDAHGYDERDHALVRNQVEKLRWAEIKNVEIVQAERRLKQLRQEEPILVTRLKDAQNGLDDFDKSHPIQQSLLDLNQRLHSLSYSLERHEQLKAQLRTAQIWQERFHDLQQARQQEPLLKQRQDRLARRLAENDQDKVAIATQLQQLESLLSKKPDLTEEILDLKNQIDAGQLVREKHLAELGRLEQQLDQLDQIKAQHDQQKLTLQTANRKYKIYHALAQAFGKNGIQALMIENILPHLEAETNQILSRLSDHQLHVQFVTQRTGRQRNKLIDTLDILIADAQGTRAYETYSGGESFRVNFAIRLALARLLAQRSGMSLQMLVVDEGFGTQDQSGCDRLIAAINAIAPDFSCILAITHMPHFREAFQTRIDIHKTETGSQITISG